MPLRRPGERPGGRTAHSCEAPKDVSVRPGVPCPAVTLEEAEEKGWPLEKKDNVRGLAACRT